MNNETPFNHESVGESFSQSQMSELEQSIHSAGRYVVPSDNHRPSTLEAARRWSQDRRIERRIGKWLLAISLFCGIGSVAIQFMMWNSSSRSISKSQEIESRAAEISRSGHVSYQMGIAEAYSESRIEQAKQFGQVSAESAE